MRKKKELELFTDTEESGQLTVGIQWEFMTAGQKAKQTFNWFITIYPAMMEGDTYAYVAGRDVGFLTNLFKSIKTATWEDVQHRLKLYLMDSGDTFLARNGHALYHFKWNAYGRKEVNSREANPRGYAGQREVFNLDSIRAISGSSETSH